jgi:ATP-dependent helicase/nuclease subunit A
LSKRLKPLPRLEGDQLRASSPKDHAALSASAGTGKTHVLTARVLRLLLSGVDPSSILCLTFTKAGAAEMAHRIHERLAYWVRLKDGDLALELEALGEDVGPEIRERARTLFAGVLDAAGGGLRIQTIHAFAQGLLAAFPAEAGLVPGFKPLEGREEKILARQTLSGLLVEAERGGDLPLISDIQALSHRLGEGGAEGFLMQCARAPDAMAAMGPREGVEARLYRAFDLPAGDIEDEIASACCDDIFDLEALRRIADANRSWGSSTGVNCCDIVAAWQAKNPVERARGLGELAGLVLTKSGEPRKPQAGLLKADPDYAEYASKLTECCQRLLRMRARAGFVDSLAAGLRAGRTFAFAYAGAKRAQGVVDFDDLIRWVERLLLEPGMGDWVRYKLDQETDHILVDEAQDTNDRQWNIVRALASEYFAGQGARKAHRTIFTVGDYKQAIFGFQGTDPSAFEAARAWFLREALATGRDFLDLSMDRSFRSAAPLLELVDRVIAEVGHDALGLPGRSNPHESHHSTRPGSVTLWLPYSEDSAEAGDEAGAEGWISDTTRRFAGKLARQIRSWIDTRFEIGEGNKRRPVRPEDIMVLVRRRSQLASLLVARLHAENVPVAGVDRLRLSAPLAVQDLLAAIRFAAQPSDDLNLASLLVSPLFGWTQEELYSAASRRPGVLWPQLRSAATEDGKAAQTVAGLQSLLAMADYATPHQFLETILSGPLEGRRKLMARLGREARDPIEELVASALQFETGPGPSLQRFLDWFARGDVEIVRDPSAPLDAVRVMTVHGSKGLQAPVVILADACVDPKRTLLRDPCFSFGPEGPEVPVVKPRKEERGGPLDGQLLQQERLEMQEHWRLLYVGLTRAEQRLYIGGSLGSRDRDGPPVDSWYAAVDRAMEGLGTDWDEDPLWGRSRRYGHGETLAKSVAAKVEQPEALLPSWLREPAPQEARPPRPLAPSAIGEDDMADPPPSPELRQAALRGKLLHRLFERLPDVGPGRRGELADQWLERSAGIADAAFRQSLVEDACAIVGDPLFAELFGPTALAEAPIAAVVEGGTVVSGTVDRLLLGEENILILDFKTSRRTPERAEDIPASHMRQMAAYAAALEVIFPGRKVEAALLYTAGPLLHMLPPSLLATYRPRIDGTVEQARLAS